MSLQVKSFRIEFLKDGDTEYGWVRYQINDSVNEKLKYNSQYQMENPSASGSMTLDDLYTQIQSDIETKENIA